MKKDLNRNFKIWDEIFSFDPNLLAKEDIELKLTNEWIVKWIRYEEVKTRRWHYYRVYETNNGDISWEHIIFSNKEDRDEEMRQWLIVSLEFFNNNKENAIKEYDEMMKELDTNKWFIITQAKLHWIEI